MAPAARLVHVGARRGAQSIALVDEFLIPIDDIK